MSSRRGYLVAYSAEAPRRRNNAFRGGNGRKSLGWNSGFLARTESAFSRIFSPGVGMACESGQRKGWIFHPAAENHGFARTGEWR
jgi:hypothetical protein